MNHKTPRLGVLGDSKLHGHKTSYDEPDLSKVYKAISLINRVTMLASFFKAPTNLHCEIEDFNLGDDFFTKDEMEVYYPDTNTTQRGAESDCYAHMKGMTVPERYMAIAILDYGDINRWQELAQED